MILLSNKPLFMDQKNDFLKNILDAVSQPFQGETGKKQGSLKGSDLEKVLDNLEDGLIVYDKNFFVSYFNPAAEKLFSLSKELVRGHQFQPQDAEKQAWRLIAQVVFPSLAPAVVSRSTS